jgi:hypothetical protein
VTSRGRSAASLSAAAHVGALAVISAVILTCTELKAPTFSRPDLSDTNWALVEIDDRAIDPGGGATLVIIGLDEIVFQTRCRTITGGLLLDMEGSGWGVVDPSLESTCPETEASADKASVDAFLAAESFAVLSDREMQLRGPHVLTLRRLGAG